MKRKTKRYDAGGEVEFETSQGQKKSISDDVRERAMRAIAAGGQKETPAAPVKKAAVRSQPESDREENSPWMRELRKKEATEAENARESQALFNKKPVDTTSKEDTGSVAKAFQTAAKMLAAKPKGMKSGGKVAGKLATRGYGIARK